MSTITTLWRQGGFADDAWTTVGTGDDIPAGGGVIVPLGRWRELRGAPKPDQARTGVAVEPDEQIEELEADLDRIALVALRFPAFTDGRAYSQARLLRERFGYRGEIRATGDVLLDQIPFMLRCGFDAFAVSHEPTRRALAAGRLPEVPLYLQPAAGQHEVAPGTRPWLRRRA